MTMTTVPSTLPHLLKTEGFETEISRAEITRILKYLDSWREWMYRSWLGEVHGSITAEEIAANVGGLMTMAIVLHCLRLRLPHLPDRLNELLCPNRDGTIADLAERLRLTVPAWMGPVLFSPLDFNSNEPIPRVVWNEDWDEQVGLALHQLFGDRPMPVWFFGDFHQLCVARAVQIDRHLNYERLDQNLGRVSLVRCRRSGTVHHKGGDDVQSDRRTSRKRVAPSHPDCDRQGHG